MNSLRIETLDGGTCYGPREEVAGKAWWSLEQPPDTLELRLFWYTQGKGTQDVGIVETVRFDHPAREERRDFRVTLPEAPFSCSGKLLSICWALELVALPSGQTGRLELTMAPDGKEIALPDAPELEAEERKKIPGILRGLRDRAEKARDERRERYRNRDA